MIPAQGALLLWRSETHIVLNDDSDHLYLFLPGGGLADEVRWEAAEPDVRFVRAGGISLAPAQGASASAGAVVEAAGEMAGEASVVAPQTTGSGDGGVLALQVAPAAAVESAPAPPVALARGVDIATARALGINVEATVRGVVILPPGLLHSTLYLAETDASGAACGPGLRVFLPIGDFPALSLGDSVVARGRLSSFRGERELLLAAPDAIIATGTTLLPPPIAIEPAAIGDALEGRLVTFSGRVAWADGDSIYLTGDAPSGVAPVRVVDGSAQPWLAPPRRTPGPKVARDRRGEPDGARSALERRLSRARALAR